jgi:hypothetical protein
MGKPRRKINMSKYMTKKGLAFGAGIALVASGLAAVPAQADTTGPVTLVPTAGTTFNSILQSGISLKSDLDPNDIGVEEAGSLAFLIENPGAAAITGTFDTAGSLAGMLKFESDTAPTTTPFTGMANANRLNDASDEGRYAASQSEATSNKYLYLTGATDQADATFEDANDVAGEYNFGTTTASNTLALATTETTKNVTLYVTSWLDADGDGLVDTFEKSSDRETVILYAVGNVSATTTVDYLLADNSAYRTTIVYNNNINPFAVAAKTFSKLFVGGALVKVTDDETDTTVDGETSDITVAAISASTTAYASVTTIGITKNTLSGGVAANGVANAYNLNVAQNNVVDMVAGTYTAQTYYNTTGDTFLGVGAASAAFDMNVGLNALVDTLEPTVTESASLDFAATNNATSVLGVKTGTKSFVVAVQALDDSATPKTLEASAIKVRATVTAVTLGSGAVSVTGSSTSLAEDDVTVGYAFTNSKGVASFTITNTVGSEDDVVTAKFEILKADGTYVDADTLTATYADAALASWSSVGGAYVSGETVNLSFKAVDQFGGVISADDAAALSVVAVASVGGISKPATYSKTVSVTDGVASFSFANFATAGASAQLVATLNAGTSAATPSGGGSATITVNVYNSNATSSLNVADSFSTAINYADNVTGALTDTAVTAAATASGIATAASVAITGNVLDVNGVGQPGAAVVLKADGVLFRDASNYALGEITTYANEYGAFSVTVFAHMVNTTGATVSITSGTVSDSTLLKTYLPNGINDENLAFSWNMPAELVKNTTYAVVATLTDKWGNPINANDTDEAVGGTDFGVAFTGTGSIEVNGVGTTVYKDFNAKGQSTVFVRSIKDIAGPGAVSATISGDSEYNTIDAATLSTLGTVDAANAVDDTATVWDETLWASTLAVERDVKDVATATSDQKVNAGSFKGFVALYAKGYEGQRMSAKVGNDWVIVPSIPAATNDLFRAVEFVGAGVDISVRIYIDRVLNATIPLLTK